MKILFIGLGSIGLRHAKILFKFNKHSLYVFRSGKGVDKTPSWISEVGSWQEVIKLMPDVVFITNPTAKHIDTALRCIKLNSKLFIEKPIGSDDKKLELLLKLVKQNKTVTYVGYMVRFHPVIKYLKKFIGKKKVLHVRVVCSSYYPYWRKGRDYLKVYSANKKLGGGVILDLSHEIDYVDYLLGGVKDMNGFFSKRSDYTVDVEDFADILLNTKFSPVNIHVDFFSHFPQRIIQIDIPSQTIVADLLKGEIKIYHLEKLQKSLLFDYDRNRMFEDQMKYFINNINNPNMMNNLTEASILYKKILKFKNRK